MFTAHITTAGVATVRQRVVAHPDRAKPRSVDLREPILVVHPTEGSRPTLAASVEAWTCLATAHGHILDLVYSCDEFLPAHEIDTPCPAREWDRYIDLQGRALDAGYAPDDPRYPVLEKRLGLPSGDQTSISPLD